MSTSTAEALVETVLNTNQALTSDQRAIVVANLKRLEEEFKKETGNPYDDPTKGAKRKKRAEELTTAIRQHRACLSIVRTVPVEIWRRIIALCVAPHTDLPRFAVIPFSGVSRLWRSAVIGEPKLWTTIPRIVPGELKVDEMVSTFLSRSGALPISWDLEARPSPPSSKDPFLRISAMLVAHCHRWREVGLICFHSQLESMAAIRGNLPQLNKLALRMFGFSEPGEPLTIFQEAPSLRDVELIAPGADETLVVGIPWAQLERIRIWTAADGDPHWWSLIASQPPDLHAIELTTYSLPPPSTTPFTLPKLSKLLIIVEEGRNLSGNLDSLILPALQNLRIVGWSERPVSIHDTVHRLIQRSKCALRVLKLDANTGDHEVVYAPIFSCSPEITELDLKDAQTADALSQLHLSLDTSTPVLPKLKKLIIRTSGVGQSVDAAAFMEMYKTRTEAIGDPQKIVGRGPFQVLEEVELAFDTENDVHHQMTLFEKLEVAAYEEAETRDVEFGQLASRARRYLLTKFLEGSSGKAKVNVKQHLKMDQLLKDLEKVDLARHNTQVLLKRGIPFLLRKVGSAESGEIPGEKMFKFRRRATDLCTKWKPFLLRDLQTQPYTWSTRGSTLSLKWQGTKTGNDLEDDQRIWQEMLGE